MQPYSNETLVQDGYFAHPSSFMETVSCRAGAVCLSVRPSVCLCLSSHSPLLLLPPQFALMATFIALCATAQPSPFAVPLSYLLPSREREQYCRAFVQDCVGD